MTLSQDLPSPLVQQFTDYVQTEEFADLIMDYCTKNRTLLYEAVARTSQIGPSKIDAFIAWHQDRTRKRVDALLQSRITIPAAVDVGAEIDKLHIKMTPEELAEFAKRTNHGKSTIALGAWRDGGNTIRRIRLHTDVEGLNFTYLTFSDKEDDTIFQEADRADPRSRAPLFRSFYRNRGEDSVSVGCEAVLGSDPAIFEGRGFSIDDWNNSDTISKPAPSSQFQLSYSPQFQQSRYYGKTPLSAPSAALSRVSSAGMEALEQAGFDPQFDPDDRSMYSSSPAPTEAMSLRSDETPIGSPLMIPFDLKVAKHSPAQLDTEPDIVRTKFRESIGSNILERFLPLGQLEIITLDPTTNKLTSEMSPWCLVVNLDDLRPWIVVNVEALKERYTTYLTPGNRLATWCNYPLPFSHGRVEFPDFPDLMLEPEDPVPLNFWQDLFRDGGSFDRSMAIGTILQYNCFAIGELVWDGHREQYVRPLTSTDFPPVDSKKAKLANAQAGAMRLRYEDIDNSMVTTDALLDIYDTTATWEYNGV